MYPCRTQFRAVEQRENGPKDQGQDARSQIFEQHDSPPRKPPTLRSSLVTVESKSVVKCGPWTSELLLYDVAPVSNSGYRVYEVAHCG